MNKLLKHIILKIQIWNPKHFINPFYSPSLDFLYHINEMFKMMKEGIDKKA